MNRTYRHVWNKAQGRFVVAAETAFSHGGGISRASRLALSATLALTAVSGAIAQITPASGRTNVYRAPNGVQVVDIEQANAAGLSHNRYTDYNVERNGVVLNNGNSAQMTRNSVLAGQVTANLNLAAEARVILNEVVSNRRSMLLGFTEVLGGKADVVVANPYGITCTGCGFINTDRALLTTGLPQIGSGGTLDGFRVMQGDILIDGAGLDATGPRLLDLVARSIKVDGRLAGTDVGITVGANNWTWANRQASAIAGTGTAPSFAFDSTVLGGMYANRIRIVATEAGVGVRMLGEVAASGDDFSLDSAGRIALNNRVSAARDIAIRQTTETGADAIAIIGSANAVVAGRDLLVASSDGGATVLDALLSAGRDLNANVQSVDNTGSIQATGSLAMTVLGALNNQATGKILADGSTGQLTIVTDTLLNEGTVQGAGLLDITAATGLDNLSGGVLRGDAFALTGGDIVNHGGARMQWNKDGNVNVASLDNAASNAVIVGSLGDGGSNTYTSTYQVAGLLHNAGAMHSGGDAVITAGALHNTSTAGMSALRDLSATVTQSGNSGSEALHNDGAFYAGRNLSLSAANGTLINAGITGTLDAGGDITATALDLINQNSIRGTNITLTGTNSFLNQPSGGLPSIYQADIGSVGEHSIRYESYNCNFFGAACDTHTVYEREVTREERLSAPLPAVKPQILAVNILTINFGAGGGANQAGILSASTINLSGGGSFTNQDFHLDRITSAYRHTVKEIDCTFCNANYTDYYPANDLQFNNTPGVSSDAISWGAGGIWSGSNGSYGQERTRVTYYTSGAGIFANTLNYTGGALRNYSSPKAVVTTPKSATGTSAALPTNPNGYFVVSQNPNAQYLVETNPLFAVGTDFVGSDFMAKRLGINPDKVMKRLGDANYEAQLIRQQLIEKTGRNLLVQKESEAKQMERLMSNAVSNANALGLVYGQTPTAAQLASLTSDMVWMVETVVNGQRVLSPMVYLAQATVMAFEGGGATIDVANANIKATSLDNTGGTISGSNSLNIVTQGDISNTSGTIKGGNVSLTSTEGSIVNKTQAETHGDDLVARTDIGKTGGIQATGSLAMDAKKDISVVGADVSAGKDASLSAGGNVTFDTIVDKTANSTASSLNLGALYNTSSNKTVATEKNIGSNLNVGNNLSIKSGGDTTIAGSNAKVGGDLNVDAAGSFNVLARQDTTSTRTSTSKSGLGVGGGLAGSEKTTTETFDGKNAGSTLQVGGNAKVKAADTITIQGSDVNVAGNADLKATQGIQVLDGLDEHRSSTKTETTTYLKLGGSTAAEANAKAKNGSGRSAEAGASASASGSLKLAETTTTTSNSGSRRSVASNLKVGGNLDMQTEGTLAVRGSNVEAGGNLNADAKNIDIQAGRNETYSSANTESKSVGIYSDAKAEAGAKANQTGTNATASASAEAGGVTTYGVRSESASSSDYSLTNTAATLKSGGNTSLNAKEQAKFVGADVQAGGDLSIKAKDITAVAAQDLQQSSSDSTTRTAGVYVGANASAGADAGNGGASANAGAEVSAGLRYNDEKSTNSSGSVTQVTSSFKSGGNITREASGTITDQGTQMEAGGNIKQSATTIKEIAANNTSYSTSSASSNDARIGVYAGAEAGADSKTGKAGADASAGFKASYDGSTSSESESSSTAVTSRYKAGGSIDSASTDKTTLIGTQFEAGKDVNLSAGSLDYQAAKDTSSKSSSSLSGSAEVKVGVVGTAGVNGSIDVDADKAKESSSTSRVGSVNAGGSINVKTTGDSSFEGTKLKAQDAVSVDAGGNVDFKAARDTSESSSMGVSASLSGGTSGSGKSRESEGGAGIGLTASGSSSNKAQVGTVEGGAGGVTINAGKNAKLEGTQVKSKGEASVQASGQVEAVAAKSSSSSYGISAGVSVGGSSGGESAKLGKAGGGVGLGVEGASSSSTQAVNIQSGTSTKKKSTTAAKTTDKKAKPTSTSKKSAEVAPTPKP